MGDLSVEAQTGVDGSMLELYRAVLALRHAHLAGSSAALDWLPSPPGTLAFPRGELVSVTNFMDRPRRVGVAGELLISSDQPPLVDVRTVVMPPSTTAWFSRRERDR